MHDLVLFFSVLFVVIFIALVMAAIGLIGKCRHRWSQWESSETEHAYVQKRMCTKCGYVSIEQFRKLKDECDDE